jgi:transposase
VNKTFNGGGIGVIRVDQYERIRNLYAIEGLSQRQIARMLGISRHTVARYCTGENLPGVRKQINRQPNVITPEIIAFIEQCFREDAELGKSKQRHTAHRIYTRLCEEKGFTGGKSTIRRAVHEIKEKMPAKASVPLHFAPAEAAQVDWGEATVFISGHKVRNSIRYVSYKDVKKITAALKTIYTASSEPAACEELNQFEAAWGDKYPLIVRSWRNNWAEISTFFKYPPKIRKIIYTTNMIESYHRQLRKVTKGKSIFPTDEALLKMLYMATQDVLRKWTGRVQNWGQILLQLSIFFPDKVKAHLR